MTDYIAVSDVICRWMTLREVTATAQSYDAPLYAMTPHAAALGPQHKGQLAWATKTLTSLEICQTLKRLSAIIEVNSHTSSPINDKKNHPTSKICNISRRK